VPKFAIYFVPREDDPFYQLGSQILGYDVRGRVSVTMPAHLQRELGEIDSTWMAAARSFGFHLTVCDALDCDWSTIPAVENLLDDLLSCFAPATEFTLQRCATEPVAIWELWEHAGAQCLVLRYHPNVMFSMLHALLIGSINPLGKGSGYLKRYLAGNQPAQPPHCVQQLRLFSSPAVLDNWFPHFTLMNPYTGSDPAAMALRLGRLSEASRTLTVHSLCLLAQEHDDANWFIYREFCRR
jgi:hypothetical protein